MSITEHRRISYAELQKQIPGLGIEQIRKLEKNAGEKRPQALKVFGLDGAPFIEPAEQRGTGTDSLIHQNHRGPAESPCDGLPILCPADMDAATAQDGELRDPSVFHHSGEQRLGAIHDSDCSTPANALQP